MGDQKLAEALGVQLREARTLAGLTQEELAHRAKLSREYISMVERGTKAVTVEVFVGLCKVLRASAPELLRASLSSS